MDDQPGKINVNKPLPTDIKIDNYFIRKYCEEIQTNITTKRKVFLQDNKNNNNNILVEYEVKNHNIRNYSIIFCHLFNLIKFLFILFNKQIEKETRIILADWSIYIAAIDSYNVLAHIFTFIWALLLRKMFYPNKKNTDNQLTWLQLFQMMNGKITPAQFGLNTRDGLIIKKFSKRAKLVFRLLYIEFWNLGKYILLINDYLIGEVKIKHELQDNFEIIFPYFRCYSNINLVNYFSPVLHIITIHSIIDICDVIFNKLLYSDIRHLHNNCLYLSHFIFS